MLTVLVADDEFAVLEVLAMTLESEGHRVLKAGDGADALRILSSQPVDVLVCDDAMPMMDGQGLIAVMRHEVRLADIPVILLVESMTRTPPPMDKVLVLTKPVRLRELVDAVGRLPQRRPKP